MRNLCIILASVTVIFHYINGEISIINRSPFVWPGFNSTSGSEEANAIQANPEDYEFHAVYELSGNTHVLLMDRKSRTFNWMIIGEANEGLIPKQYIPEQNLLLLIANSKEIQLKLQELPAWSSTPISGAGASRENRSSISPIRSATSSRSIARPPTSSIRRTVSSRGTIPSPPSTRMVPTRGRTIAGGSIPSLIEPDITNVPAELDYPEPTMEPPKGPPPSSSPGNAPANLPQRP